MVVKHSFKSVCETVLVSFEQPKLVNVILISF